jgi:sulfite reductase (ferredoxin)
MFKLPNNLIEMIDTYRTALQEFLDGKITPARFKGIRVPMGFYTQRGEKVLMARVRVPGGVLTPEQLRAIAELSEKLNVRPHITDRQDIQLHGVKYEDSIKVLEFLKDYNLSTIGGGGNTVRNVTACYLSGICRNELFDVRKYAIAISECLLKNPSAVGKLPRKFKIGFSGCQTDCAYALVNDVGLIAKIKDGVKGFRVYCGGGMGAFSSIGQVLEDFIPEERLGYVVKAIMLTYNKYGDRLNRHHNRLRFLIQDKGFDTFRKWYEEELKNITETEYVSLRDIEFHDAPECEELNLANTKSEEKDFQLFLKNCVTPQKTKGRYIIELNLHRGDVEPPVLKALSHFAQFLPEIEFRTNQFQNLLLCNIPGSSLYEVYIKLKQIFKDNSFLNSGAPLKMVICKGAATCNLGICNSPGLADAIAEELKKDGLNYDALKGFNIKISGCPNNCGQHVLGVIGLTGLTRKVNLRPVPLYKILLGGSTGEESTKFGSEIGVVPSRNVPRLLVEFLKDSEKKTQNYPSVYEFLKNEGIDLMQSLIKKYSYIPDYEENHEFYRDWGRSEDFSLAGIGPGECGAGVIDLIEADLAEAERMLNLAREKGYERELVKNALIYSARALQVVKGLEPKTDRDVVDSFVNEFVSKGIADRKWIKIKEIFESLAANEGDSKNLFAEVNEFYNAIRTLYREMDPNFRFPSEIQEEQKPAESGYFLDLKGVACPFNYVKAKLFMEPLNKGSIITLILDEGEPIRNVPQSLKNDGHDIIEMTKIDENHYKLVVKKA